jgi:FkbM family methyltransferase
VLDEVAEFGPKAVLSFGCLGLPDSEIVLNPGDKGLSNQLLKGLREPINTFFLSKFVRERKPVVLDIGGNIGYFPLVEAVSGAEFVKVYEPVPETFRFLVANTADLDNVTCHNLAIAESACELEMVVPEHRNMASLVPSFDYLDACGVDAHERVTVNCETLMSACMDLPDGVLVRCDIEGYEAHIFGDVPENVSGISLELHTAILGPERSMAFVDSLVSQGFTVELMSREMEGLTGLFRRFGFVVFRLYNKFVEKRIYVQPTRQEIERVVRLQRENPHIFAFR